MKRDLYAEVSARIVAELEAGAAPWVKPWSATPGANTPCNAVSTVLVRDWDRRSQWVMVMADGFAWNGQTYDSLSKVAFAITGTKWNGPRFFGLRDKEDRLDEGARS
jgi:hypothetical protein